jgi:hypothetical protein
MGDQDTRSGIRVRKPKPIKDLNLPSRHFPRLGAALMVKTLKMQHAVNHHVRPVRSERLALRFGLACHHGCADHQFAQILSPVGALPRTLKRQHIGGPALIAISRVQAQAARGADHTHGEDEARWGTCSASRSASRRASRRGTRRDVRGALRRGSASGAAERRARPSRELRAPRHPWTPRRIAHIEFDARRHWEPRRRRRGYSLRRLERFSARAGGARRRAS